MSEELRRQRPPVHHPVLLKHPITGRNVIYVNPGFTVRIDGLPENENAALLRMLLDHVLQDKYRYVHEWAVGDLLGPKAMWQIPVKGSSPLRVRMDHLRHACLVGHSPSHPQATFRTSPYGSFRSLTRSEHGLGNRWRDAFKRCGNFYAQADVPIAESLNQERNSLDSVRPKLSQRTMASAACGLKSPSAKAALARVSPSPTLRALLRAGTASTGRGEIFLIASVLTLNYHPKTHAAVALSSAARARLILARISAPAARQTYGFGSALRCLR